MTGKKVVCLCSLVSYSHSTADRAQYQGKVGMFFQYARARRHAKWGLKLWAERMCVVNVRNHLKPYNHMKDFKNEQQNFRGNWYSMSSTTIRKAEIEPSMLYVVGQQHYWSNFEAGTQKDFYKGVLTIHLVDHHISEMDTYFDPNPVCTSSLNKFLRRIPCANCFAVLCRCDDLPSPQVFDVEFFCWGRKRLCVDQDLPSSATFIQALEECDNEFFPNVHTLLHILCTLPISSVQCEQLFSSLCQLKTDLMATMTTE